VPPGRLLDLLTAVRAEPALPFPEHQKVAHVGQVVADITPRIAHRNDGVARFTL
jgi:hypothetical protein